MLGKKRAVLMTRSVQNATGPQGPMQKQIDLTKVFPLSTTLEEILGYCTEKGTNITQIIFESEAPEVPREDDQEREN